MARRPTTTSSHWSDVRAAVLPTRIELQTGQPDDEELEAAALRRLLHAQHIRAQLLQRRIDHERHRHAREVRALRDRMKQLQEENAEMATTVSRCGAAMVSLAGAHAREPPQAIAFRTESSITTYWDSGGRGSTRASAAGHEAEAAAAAGRCALPACAARAAEQARELLHLRAQLSAAQSRMAADCLGHPHTQRDAAVQVDLPRPATPQSSPTPPLLSPAHTEDFCRMMAEGDWDPAAGAPCGAAPDCAAGVSVSPASVNSLLGASMMHPGLAAPDTRSCYTQYDPPRPPPQRRTVFGLQAAITLLQVEADAGRHRIGAQWVSLFAALASCPTMLPAIPPTPSPHRRQQQQPQRECEPLSLPAPPSVPRERPPRPAAPCEVSAVAGPKSGDGCSELRPDRAPSLHGLMAAVSRGPPQTDMQDTRGDGTVVPAHGEEAFAVLPPLARQGAPLHPSPPQGAQLQPAPPLYGGAASKGCPWRSVNTRWGQRVLRSASGGRSRADGRPALTPAATYSPPPPSFSPEGDTGGPVAPWNTQESAPSPLPSGSPTRSGRSRRRRRRQAPPDNTTA